MIHLMDMEIEEKFRNITIYKYIIINIKDFFK